MFGCNYRLIVQARKQTQVLCAAQLELHALFEQQLFPLELLMAQCLGHVLSWVCELVCRHRDPSRKPTLLALEVALSPALPSHNHVISNTNCQRISFPSVVLDRAVKRFAKSFNVGRNHSQTTSTPSKIKFNA